MERLTTGALATPTPGRITKIWVWTWQCILPRYTPLIMLTVRVYAVCFCLIIFASRGRHLMETFSALLALCRGIHRSPVNSPHKGQWRGALMFSSICARINGWVTNREAGDLRRQRAHYDAIVMFTYHSLQSDFTGTVKQLWKYGRMNNKMMTWDIQNKIWQNITIIIVTTDRIIKYIRDYISLSIFHFPNPLKMACCWHCVLEHQIATIFHRCRNSIYHWFQHG